MRRPASGLHLWELGRPPTQQPFRQILAQPRFVNLQVAEHSVLRAWVAGMVLQQALAATFIGHKGVEGLFSQQFSPTMSSSSPLSRYLIFP